MSEPLHADEVARKDFPLSFRGFDQHEVRSFLGLVAAELGSWEERERTLRARIAELEASPAPEALDEAALEVALGREATRVLHAAREAAAEIRAKAEMESGQKVEAADTALAQAKTEASSAMDTVRAEVERRANEILEESGAKAAAMMVDATAERDRILRDLADRRATMVAELEALHAARLRLAEAYRVARLTLDAAVGEVELADAAASAVTKATVAAPPEPPSVTPLPPPGPIEWIPTRRPEDGGADVVVVGTAKPDAAAVAAPAVVAEPEPEPDAEPEPERDPDERRSSALKLLRRKHEPEPAAVVVRGEVEERVRIIRPEPQPEPALAAEPEPAPEVAPEPAVAPEPEVAPGPEPERATAPVEDLFVRLRADRAEKVAKAEAVLAATDASPREPRVEDLPPAVEAPAADLSPDLAFLAARDIAVADAERGLVRSLKRALADEQNEVLDALRRLRGVPSIAALLPDVAVHDARYGAVLSSGAAVAATAGGAVGGGTGGDAGAVASEIGTSIASDLRTRVDRSIDDAGGDVDTLAEAISSAYREWKTGRVDGLARDVITASFAYGVFHAASSELRWVVDPAEGGCPDCDDNALAGPTPRGAAFPTGQLHPPAHAGCRCTVVPAS